MMAKKITPTTVNRAIVPQGRSALTLTGVIGRRPDLPPLVAGRLPLLTKTDLEPPDLPRLLFAGVAFLPAARFEASEPERLGLRVGFSASASSSSSDSSTSSSSSSGFVFLVMDLPRSGLGVLGGLHPKLIPAYLCDGLAWGSGRRDTTEPQTLPLVSI